MAMALPSKILGSACLLRWDPMGSVILLSGHWNNSQGTVRGTENFNATAVFCGQGAVHS